MRTRLLHPEFFRHEEVANIDPWARLLFQGLWTLADREGRLEDRPRRIKADVFPYDDVDVDLLLDTLVARGFLVAYEFQGRGYLHIPSFVRWQNPHPKEKPSVFPEPGKGAIRPRNYMASFGKAGTSRAVSDSDLDTVSDLSATTDEKPSAAPAKPKDPRHQEMLDRFCVGFMAKRGNAYSVSGPDVAAVKRLRADAAITVAEFQRRLDHAWCDDFFRDRNPTLAYFVSKWSVWGSPAPPANGKLVHKAIAPVSGPEADQQDNPF